MKTEFKDVAKYYLGTGLEFYGSSDYRELVGIYNNKIFIKTVKLHGSVTSSIDIDDFILEHDPVMHSLDKLTEPITVDGYNDGEPFMPLFYLLADKKDWDKMKVTVLNQAEKKYKMPKVFHVSHEDLGRVYNIYPENLQATLPFKMFNQLIQWHFNVFGVDCIDK